mmetsp:Transcript_24856/g.38670  ORF Transcript_24856/g.38670 Transcript_24856/m.38670 type:complete len:91 (-) Transcript_24856:940-1212(-)
MKKNNLNGTHLKTKKMLNRLSEGHHSSTRSKNIMTLLEQSIKKKVKAKQEVVTAEQASVNQGSLEKLLLDLNMKFDTMNESQNNRMDHIE